MNTVTESSSGESLPSPKIVLYPEDKINLQWEKPHKIGSGHINMGNTCFLNSTLQCLTYTAPLVNYCLSGEHIQSCKQLGFCMLCELQRHIRRCHENSGSNIIPQAILQNLKMIAKHMHWGRQEDAHEFLRYVVDSMQRSTLNGHTMLDTFSKETTVVNQIFGGYLRSQVQCLRCNAKSNTYDPFMDISLDIKTVPSLEKAFENYVQPEKLDCDNAYMCDRCKQKVPALKRFSIDKAPNVLTISLKRFDYQGKIRRHVHFPDKLNLRPYMSAKQGDALLFNLNAVLVHSGYTANSGHYYCYVKSSTGVWYCMNDANVQEVSISRVLDAEAYVLFYTKAHSECSIPKPTHTVTVPNHVNKKCSFKPLNGVTRYPSTDTGVPIARTTSSSTMMGSYEYIVVNDGKPSLYMNGKNQILQDMRESEKQRNDHRVVFDKKLNATTSVPGNAHLLETTLNSNRQKHKKERKHDDCDEERRGRKRKRSYEDVDEDSRKEKKKKLDIDSYVWVEKTKDTIIQRKSDSSVLVQSWDQHKKSKNGSGDGKSYSTWDGSRSSKVAEELERRSSAIGYGSSVNSWEGGVLDIEMEEEKRNNKRHWSDEDELDHGKIKKIKKDHPDCNVHSGYNAFQKYQYHRNYKNNRFKGV